MFIDHTTATIFITFNCYEPSADRFIVTHLTFDYSVGGMIFVMPAKIICYSLD